MSGLRFANNTTACLASNLTCRHGLGKDGEFQKNPTGFDGSRNIWYRAEGQSMSQEEFDVAKERRLKFKDFSEAMFGNDAVMITPYQFGEPDARDVYRLE